MIKYIITSGNSVVNNLSEQNVQITTEISPVHFDRIGDAMKAAVEVNKMIGSYSFKVVSIEI